MAAAFAVPRSRRIIPVIWFATIFPLAAANTDALVDRDLIPVQLSMIHKAPPVSTAATRKQTTSPAKPADSLTPDEDKRLTEAINRLSPKERKRLAKTLKKMTPEDRAKLAMAMKRQLAGKTTAPQAVARPR